MNRSQRRKMLKDAGLLGKQAEKNGIKKQKTTTNKPLFLTNKINLFDAAYGP